MPLIYPENQIGQVRLYGDTSELPPDVLFISIDDDDYNSFTCHIDPLLDVCKAFNSDLTFWLMHLADNDFATFKPAIEDFAKYIQQSNLPEGIKQKAKEAPTKIWLIDLFDQVNQGEFSISTGFYMQLVNISDQKAILFSQQGSDIGKVLRSMGNVPHFQKISNPSFETVTTTIYPVITPFLPDRSPLSSVLPNQWHEMRFSDAIKRKEILTSAHHWGIIPERSSDGQEAILKWELLNRITMQSNKSTLKEYLGGTLEYGTVYRQVMFSSQTLMPSIKELLQTCKCDMNLTAYVNRMQEHLNKCRQQLTRKIKVEIKADIKQDYLWFNVVALSGVFRDILSSYDDELKKNNYQYKEASMNITLKEIMNGDRKGIEVLVKEDPLIVVKMTFPYRANSVTINDGVVKNILSNLHTYLKVANIFYKVNGKCRGVNIECVLNKNSGCITEDVVDTDDFTFKWFIEADETDEPYKCDYMTNKKCWTVKGVQ